MKKRLLSVFSLLLVVAMLFTACGQKAAEEKPAASAPTNSASAAAAPAANSAEPAKEVKIQDTVTVGINRDFNTLNPCGSTVGVDCRVWYSIYEGLTTFDSEFNVIPRVATSWENVDDCTLRFHLRDDVYFQNGDKLKPEDVIYSIKRCQALPSVGGELNPINVEKCKVVDATTVDIVTDTPYAPLLRTLTNPYVFLIVSQSWCEANGDDLAEKPMGTGPFKFVSRTVGDSVVLEKNDKYWGNVAKFNKLVFRVIIEGTTRAIEVETEGIDIGQGLAVNDVVRLQKGDKVGITFVNMPSVVMINMNMTKAPLNDVKVRQAINYAIDMDSIVEAIYMGLQKPMTSIIASTVSGFAEIEQYGYDVEKAKALLKEAGYENGLNLVFKVAENADYVSCAEMIKNQLAQVGVNVDIQAADSAATSAALKSFDYDLGLRSWGASSGDPDSGIWPICHSTRLGIASYAYSDEETDKLLEKARVTIDATERANLYKQIQQRITDLSAYIYFTELKFFDGTHNRVVGYQPLCTAQCNFNEMYVIAK